MESYSLIRQTSVESTPTLRGSSAGAARSSWNLHESAEAAASAQASRSALLTRGAVPLSELGYHDVRSIEEWYDQFTWAHSIDYVWETTGSLFIFYACWSGFLIWLEWEDPEMADFETGDVLKVLIFLTGLLISLLLKEALDAYRKCLFAIMDFRAHFRGLWYQAQMPALRKNPAMIVLIDLHMMMYALSIASFLLKKSDLYGEEATHISTMVQPEFRSCILFQDEEYNSLVTNPGYAELLLVSWLRTTGTFGGELQKKFKDTRGALRRLIVAQRVRSPGTTGHMLRAITHLFLVAVPVCVKHTPTRLLVPVVAVVLFVLLSFAQELEDPFGLDRHDLPWPVMLEDLGYVTLSNESRRRVPQTIDFFNHYCRTGKCDQDTAEDMFGKDLSDKPFKGNKFDSGLVHLDVYLTLDKLRKLDVVGSLGEVDPDLLFPLDVHHKREKHRPHSATAAHGAHVHEEGESDDSE